MTCPVSGQSSENQGLSRCHRNSCLAHNPPPPPPPLDHPNLQNPVDRANTVAIAVVAQEREMLKVCSDVCNTPISRRTICAPLELGLLVESNLFASPLAYMSLVEVKTKSSWIHSILRSTQQQCQNRIALLVDCNIHYRVLIFLYSRATMDSIFPMVAGHPLNSQCVAPLQTPVQCHVA